MIKIRKNLVPKEKYAIKCPYTMIPTRIVVHNTANDASAINEIKYMIRNNNEVSFHYAVDDKEIVQGIEENRNAWHSGDGNGKGNREGIAIEICYSKSGGNKFTLAEINAVHLIVDILKRYNWNIDKVTKHQDYSNKYCPHRTLDLGWSRFINMIEKELKETNKIPFALGETVYNIEDLTLSTTAGYGGDTKILKKNIISKVKKYHFNKELYVALTDLNGNYYTSAWTKDIDKLVKYKNLPIIEDTKKENVEEQLQDFIVEPEKLNIIEIPNEEVNNVIEIIKKETFFKKFITTLITFFKSLVKYILKIVGK